MDAQVLEVVRLAVEGGVGLLLSVAVLTLWRAYRSADEAHKETLKEMVKLISGNLNTRVLIVEERMTALEGIASSKTLQQVYRDNPASRSIAVAGLED